MSRILCTFPGRAGDLLWACSVIRDISAFHDTPVDLVIAGEFASLVPLLQQQPYLSSVAADPEWALHPEQGWCWQKAETEGHRWAHVHQLGYRRWPELPLPFEIWNTVASGFLPRPALSRPWITVKGPGIPLDLAVGFTEAWFELKLGLLSSVEYLLGPAGPTMQQLSPFRGRWMNEVPPAGVCVYECDWLDAARAIRNSDLFFGDCSALHVLAVALGKRCVLMEPMEARWNPIFYPLGKTGPHVTLVTGNDGLPTFDARHCAGSLKRALQRV
jgi:hypothetical protein